MDSFFLCLWMSCINIKRDVGRCDLDQSTVSINSESVLCVEICVHLWATWKFFRFEKEEKVEVGIIYP